jgi:hypothetical protein
MLGKFLGFGRMHENKTFFLFLKKEIDLKVFEIFFKSVLIFFKMFRRKPGILIPDLYFTV